MKKERNEGRKELWTFSYFEFILDWDGKFFSFSCSSIIFRALRVYQNLFLWLIVVSKSIHWTCILNFLFSMSHAWWWYLLGKKEWAVRTTAQHNVRRWYSKTLCSFWKAFPPLFCLWCSVLVGKESCVLTVEKLVDKNHFSLLMFTIHTLANVLVK